MVEKERIVCALDLFHLFPRALETKVDRFYALLFQCMPLINAYNYAQCTVLKLEFKMATGKLQLVSSSETGEHVEHVTVFHVNPRFPCDIILNWRSSNCVYEILLSQLQFRAFTG